MIMLKTKIFIFFFIYHRGKNIFCITSNGKTIFSKLNLCIEWKLFWSVLDWADLNWLNLKVRILTFSQSRRFMKFSSLFFNMKKSCKFSWIKKCFIPTERKTASSGSQWCLVNLFTQFLCFCLRYVAIREFHSDILFSRMLWVLNNSKTF